MEEWQIGLICVVAMFVLMVLRMHIGITMGLTAFIGVAILNGIDSAFSILAQTALTQGSNYMMSVIPLYMLMGEFAFLSELSLDAYKTVNKWLGHLPGGLAMATIGACAAFAAVQGSSIAGAVIMVAIAYPEMKARGYANSMSLGCIAAGGTMGILIPPSNAFVVYGIMTEQSIGKLFTAGIIPGLLLTVFFWSLTYIWCRRNPRLGPPGRAVGWRERIISLKDLWSVAVLFGLVMGGIYSGIFNATEAAGVGVLAAFLIALIRGRLTRQGIKRCVQNTLRTTGMIFMMVVGAMLFNYLLTLSGLTTALADFCMKLPIPPVGIIVAICILFGILGCLMDAWAMMLIVVPAVYPTVLALGFHPLWFGVIVVIMMEMGMITPPVGMNVFVMAGMVKEVPMSEIFSGMWPFVLGMALLVGLIIAFPEIALFLPRVMG
ncbi:MAG TPA: TRAP transporter large permease [Thermodesulfobacteriota bacterium]|nr:TRAP transporter large permease [Thermodesulfobacteriota bacterium]